MVGGILCNPIYAGIPPFPELVPESQWRSVALKQIREVGARQFLVNMLYVLKRSFGAPGQGLGLPPDGYEVEDGPGS
jgi:hypothetical protein